MSLELWNSLAATATLLVIGAASVAAIVQLRHMRSSNQILVLDGLEKDTQRLEYAEAQHFVLTGLAATLQDPAFRRQLVDRGARTAANQELMTKAFLVGNFYNYLGELVKRRLLDPEVACEYWAGSALVAWRALMPLTAVTRRADTRIWENFEYFVVLAEDHARKKPSGYPRGVRRLRVDDVWLEADTKDADARAQSLKATSPA